MIEFLVNFSNFINPVFYKILYMSMVGSLLGILIMFITKVVDNKMSAKWKCLVWIIPLMFLMIPINRIQISAKNNIVVTNIVDKVENSLVNAHTLAKENNISKENEESTETLIKTSTNNVNNTDITVYIILPIIWLIGTIISLFMIIIGNIYLNYKINHTKELYDKGIELILMKCKIKLQITRKIDIRLQNINASPCIYGILNPKILVSEEFIKNNSDIIENVFMHELSHYKRKDMITNLILLIITSIHWFNPFVYGFFKKIRQEMELATDEIALSRMNKEEKKQYGLTLISLLQIYENEKTTTKMLCIKDDSKNMERRIKKIKWATKFKKYKTSIIILVATVILFIISPFVLKPNVNAISKEDEMLYKKVEQYLIKVEQNNHYIERKEFYMNDDFKVFIDMAKLGIKKNTDETYVYVWALIQTCNRQEELVTSGSSVPYKFIIKNGEIVDYQVPEDGENYQKSIETIFPKDIVEKIEKNDKLVETAKIENEIKKYYSLNNYELINNAYIDNNMEKTNKFEGKWEPYLAEQNGDEVSLRNIYGSGIVYGGELILNKDGTYTEFIGIYSNDMIDNLQGEYTIYGNGEKAILTTNNKEKKILELLESSNVNSSESTLVQMLEDGTKIFFKKVN